MWGVVFAVPCKFTPTVFALLETFSSPNREANAANQEKFCLRSEHAATGFEVVAGYRPLARDGRGRFR